MINQILLIFTLVLIYEFFRYFKLINIIKTNISIYKKILKLFKFRKVSDSRKEKLLFNYSKKLMLTSLNLLAIFTFVLIFIFVLNLLFNSYLNFITSFLGVIEFIILFLIYNIIRKKFFAKL